MCFVKFFLNSFFLFFIDYVIKHVIIFREYHIDNRTELSLAKFPVLFRRGVEQL